MRLDFPLWILRQWRKMREATLDVDRTDQNFTQAFKNVLATTGSGNLNNLPVVFVLGDLGSGKTSILTRSGIDAELLTGEASQANSVAPTTYVNLWLSRNTLFVDPSGQVLADAIARRKLFNRFSPLQWKSLFVAKSTASRSVLLTVDCSLFLQSSGANRVAAKAKEYKAILNELSRELGVSFPVYVLFTKADQITHFSNYVESLNESEREIFGLSLSIPPSGSLGLFRERQSKRLDDAFQTLYYSLAEKRTFCLKREQSADILSNIYEFPREFAKLRPLLVQFLTGLCLPGVSRTGPFLRGFYFSGVRTGRISQPVFLKNLFPGVLLADGIGRAVALNNSKIDSLHRLLLTGIITVALGLAAWSTVSYRHLSQLIQAAAEAARAIPSVRLSSGQRASAEGLQRLSMLRESLTLLNRYQQTGPPWRYRALGYRDDAIRLPVRATYFALFRKLLLQPVQQRLVEIIKIPGDDLQYPRYDYSYKALKAYLITTTDHDKHWNDLESVLLRHWRNEQPVGPQRETQAAANFVFYAAELRASNPYSDLVPDKEAVATARQFLNGFPVEDRVYGALLSAAGDRSKSIVFNRDYPGTEESVQNSYAIAPRFTRNGYFNFQKRQQYTDADWETEDWVLGQQHVAPDRLRASLQARYDRDFTSAWREFLAATNEAVPYANYAQAAFVLEKLGGPQSSLMQLFCVASENTNVPSQEVAQAFQPIQWITPPGCKTHLVSPAANSYVASLASLGKSLNEMSLESKSDRQELPSVKTAIAHALIAEATLQQSLRPDPSDPKEFVLNRVASLLKDPIANVLPTLKSARRSASAAHQTRNPDGDDLPK